MVLFGLAHSVDVVRRPETSDGSGGIVAGTAVAVYEDRQCRITILSPEDKETSHLFGMASEEMYKVLFEPSTNIKKNDFVQVLFGTFPNVGSPLGLEEGFPPQVVISTPAGNKTLTWSATDSNYQDSLEDYIVSWTGSVWRFEDTIAVLTVDFTGYLEGHNIFYLDWSSVVGASYSVVSQGGDAQEYRVVWVKHQIDHNGIHNHTSVVMELEDGV